MDLPLPGESLHEGDLICVENEQTALFCFQLLSPAYCLGINQNFPDGVICVESGHGNSLCSAGTAGNPGVVRQDEEERWRLGGVMANGGLNNCQAGFPFWMTSAEYFIDWIRDVMVPMSSSR